MLTREASKPKRLILRPILLTQVGKQALTMAVDRARSTRELVRRKGIHLEP